MYSLEQNPDTVAFHMSQRLDAISSSEYYVSYQFIVSVDKKNQLDVTFCILYFSSNSCSTCFGQPCAHRQELKTA